MALTVADLLTSPAVRGRHLPLEAFAVVIPLPTLRHWVATRQLVAVGSDRRGAVGRPVLLYRVGDVVDLRQANAPRSVAS